MKNRKLQVITCPNCGREYLPAEIFIPSQFIGQPKNIERDFSGAIVDFAGDSMNLSETYTCDGCNTLFRVFSRVSFVSSQDKLGNFDDDYVTTIHQDNLFLDEEEK